jgi:hypothetical protein
MASEQDDDSDHPRILPIRTLGFHLCAQGRERGWARVQRGFKNIPTDVEPEQEEEEEEEEAYSKTKSTVPPCRVHVLLTTSNDQGMILAHRIKSDMNQTFSGMFLW